ncbi:MAG TPA: DUF1549 domain-containing protein [Roseimicrobium sp.]|nr:DUF1549 domain-containing protein [Roseimicrobium sp.]
MTAITPKTGIVVRSLLGTSLLLGIAAAMSLSLIALEPTKEQAEFFTTKIEPILKESCYQCHSHSSDKIKGGLAADTLAGLISGGDTGPAIIPGNPDESLLIKAISYKNDDLQMPPKGKKLAPEQIALLTEWVKQGAQWPGPAGRKIPAARGKITEQDRQWWAFQPIKNPPVPATKNATWSKNEIDRFILSRLEKEGLTPSPAATKTALIRRVTFDLIGLPPTPGEIENFVSDTSPNAYEKLVDRLLASPRYGERWARHWLDLVRYADSDGYRIDDFRPAAWRFRDYVVRSFNDDKPYDRFVKEQLAGDELYPENPDALIATGYLRHWIYEYNARDARGQWSYILNDITDTTGDVFLGLGMQCARCHDHKFDPILQKDYYRLQAFFASVVPRLDLVAATAEEKAEHAKRMLPWEKKTESIRNQIAEIEGSYKKKAEKEALERFPDDVKAMIFKPDSERGPYEQQITDLAYRQVYYEYDRLDQKIKGEQKDKLLALRKELASFEKDKPEPLPIAMAATDVGPVAPPVFIPKKSKEPIEPGYPTVLQEAPAVIKAVPTAPNSTGRRSELARWLTDPSNPLSARVIVNRVWQYHFGKGLAANASDFGKLGEAPSHPELLDWLSTRFVKDGWSFKKLHKQIVLSSTYCQSVTHPAPQAGRLKDPENRFFWRGNVRRLDAEQIHDAIYAVTGELDVKAGGPGVMANDPRRSIYHRIMRNTRDPLMDVFDAPLWFNSASSRDVTTTPVQSLMLINSQMMLKRSEALAKRLEKEASADEAHMLEYLYQLTYGRSPTPQEVTMASTFLAEQRDRIDPVKAGSAGAAFLYEKLPFRDGQAAVLTPGTAQSMFSVSTTNEFPKKSFTIEAFVMMRSVYDSAAVRTIAAKWDGSMQTSGWGFGVTGKQSRRKPQTLVLQIITGSKKDSKYKEHAFFSDQTIQLNKPYYLSVAVDIPTGTNTEGAVHFYVKDLSNDDEPLLAAHLPHKITADDDFSNDLDFTLGGRSGKANGNFDGLMDDVRISNTALGVNKLLFTAENIGQETLAYWQFEPKPDVFQDSTGHGFNIRPSANVSRAGTNIRKTALQDLCHIILNSNEFLYVE